MSDGEVYRGQNLGARWKDERGSSGVEVRIIKCKREPEVRYTFIHDKVNDSMRQSWPVRLAKKKWRELVPFITRTDAREPPPNHLEQQLSGANALYFSHCFSWDRYLR